MISGFGWVVFAGCLWVVCVLMCLCCLLCFSLLFVVFAWGYCSILPCLVLNLVVSLVFGCGGCAVCRFWLVCFVLGV